MGFKTQCGDNVKILNGFRINQEISFLLGFFGEVSFLNETICVLPDSIGNVGAFPLKCS